MLVSLIIPCWDEELCLARFYKETVKTVAGLDEDFEFLFIDDGSTDETFAELKKLVDTDARIRILRMSRNFGSYSAITAGLEHCTGDAAIYLSADLQDPPSLIPDMIASWEDGADIVWAVRSKRSGPLLKNLFERAFYGLMRKIAFPELSKNGMDFALIDRRVINVYRALPERDTIPALTIFKLGFNQTQIHYERPERIAGTSGWPFWRRVGTAIDVIITFSYVPVRLISLIGFLAAGIGLLYALLIVFMWILYGFEIPGWASVMVVVLIVSGIQMVSLGFVSEYLWRQSKQVRAEPRYIVMDEYGEAGTAKPVNSIDDVHNINVASPNKNSPSD